MRRVVPTGVLVAAAVVAGGCSYDAAGDDDDDSDAGVPHCEMSFMSAPSSPEAGATVELNASIAKDYVTGIETFTWQVLYEGGAVALAPLDADSRGVSFVAAEAGIYDVVLDGDVDGLDCVDASGAVPVGEAGADSTSFRFRFVPRPGQAAAIDERVHPVLGGVGADLGIVQLDGGIVQSGVVQSASLAPIAAYLRAVPVGVVDPFAVETFAGDDGAFDVRLEAGLYDVLVVPDDAAVAPALLGDRSVSELEAIVLPAAQPVTGAVVDAAGDPVAGAAVSMRVGGVPSTLATTDAGGAFTVYAQLGGAAAITVVPPEDAGLPILELPAAAGLVPGAEALTVRYAAFSSRAVSVTATTAGAASPAPGARVTWIAGPLAGAGAVEVAGGATHQAAGRVRAVAVAGGDGVTAPVVVPEVGYRVAVEPAGAGAVALRDVDLSPGEPAPATLALGTPVAASGSVADGEGVAVGGVRVTAVPTGDLAGSPAAGATTTTAADGSYTLALVGGGSYELVFDDPQRRHPRARGSAVAPSSDGALPATALGDAVTVEGQVRIGGSATAGVTVLVYCFECGALSKAPVAEAVTDVAGRFRLAVPDPGGSQ